MPLTERRKQFLAAIEEAYERRGEPLHYEDVARLLGVSKWTAYDMVRELAKEGLVTIEYTTRQDNQVGRSRIAIKPRVSVSPANSFSGEFARLLQTLNRPDSVNVHKHWQDLLAKASTCGSKEMFCTYVIAALMLLAHRFLRQGLVSLLESLLITSRPELGLVAAIGLVLGILIRAGINPETVAHLQESVTSFQQYVGEITDEERRRIRAFWQAALSTSLENAPAG